FGPACELRSSSTGLSTVPSRSSRLRSAILVLSFGHGCRLSVDGALRVLSEVARDQQLPVGAQVLRIVVEHYPAVRKDVPAVGGLERQVHVLRDERAAAAAPARERPPHGEQPL